MDHLGGERLMLARVPATQIPTLYTRVGEVLPITSAGVLVLGLVALARRRWRR